MRKTINKIKGKNTTISELLLLKLFEFIIKFFFPKVKADDCIVINKTLSKVVSIVLIQY